MRTRNSVLYMTARCLLSRAAGGFEADRLHRDEGSERYLPLQLHRAMSFCTSVCDGRIIRSTPNPAAAPRIIITAEYQLLPVGNGLPGRAAPVLLLQSGRFCLVRLDFANGGGETMLQRAGLFDSRLPALLPFDER
jgi:hypothetical protein